MKTKRNFCIVNIFVFFTATTTLTSSNSAVLFMDDTISLKEPSSFLASKVLEEIEGPSIKIAKNKEEIQKDAENDQYPEFFISYPSFNDVMRSPELQRRFMHDVYTYHGDWVQKLHKSISQKAPVQNILSNDQFADDFQVFEVSNQKLQADAFVEKIIEYESKYVEMARNTTSGMTYDGYWLTQLMELNEARDWSAASKEAQDLALLIKVLSNHEAAKKFIDYEIPSNAFAKTLDLLETKINAYVTFAQNFPVFGGSLPWFQSGDVISPTGDWRNRTPGLDNGEFYFTIYTTMKILIKFSSSNYGTQEERDRALRLSTQFDNYFYNIIMPNVKVLFWDPALRKIRAVVKILNPDLDHIQVDNYENNTENYYLDDPYEGMMMRLFLSLFSDDMAQLDKDSLWADPRAAYTAVGESDGHGITWEGFWNSPHEEWMWFNFPLFGEGFEVAKKIFEIRQKRRMKLAIEVANTIGEKHGLRSAINTGSTYTANLGMRGTPSFQPIHWESWYTPSAAWTSILNDVRRNMDIVDPSNHRFYGLAWLLHMLKTRGNPSTVPDMSIQGPQGFGESYSDSGQLTRLKTVDGSFLVYVAMLGGIGDEMKEALIEDHKWNDEDYGFTYYMQPQFHNTFGSDASNIPDPVPYSDTLLPTKVVQLELPPEPQATTIDRNLNSDYWYYGYTDRWGSGTIATRDANGALTVVYDGSDDWGWGGGRLSEALIPADNSAFFLKGTGSFQLKLEGDSPDQIFDVTLAPDSWTEIPLDPVAGESYNIVVLDRITTDIYISDFWYRANTMP